jgi:uncharacterized membrane protein (DUF106 family)
MSTLNSLLQSLIGGALYPFRQVPWVGLTLISLLTAIGMLLIFKRASNQQALEVVKRRIHACLFEIRLFNDDLRAIMRAQFEILRHNLTYLRLQVIPLLFILPPIVLLLAQLQPHYGYRGLEPGQPVLLKVEFHEGQEAAGTASFGADAKKPSITLEVPDGLRVETPAVWIPSRGEMAWRLVAERPGDYELGVNVAGKSYGKAIRASDQAVKRSPKRVEPSLVEQFLYPAEAPLPDDAPLRVMEVGYPEDPEFLLMPRWMWIFFVLTIVFAFALRKPLKVTI